MRILLDECVPLQVRNGQAFITKEGFRNCFFITFTVVVCVIFTGCGAAYNARTVESPDWKYAANCYIRGGFGHSYVHDDKKLVRVSIYALKANSKEIEEKEKREAANSTTWMSKPGDSGTNKLLFEKQYWVKGSALDWNSNWGSQSDFSITFYDYGPGVSSAEKDAPKRFLKTLKYRFDPMDGVYKEAAAQAP